MDRESAQCSHASVVLRPTKHADGTYSDRWVCRGCPGEFTLALLSAPPDDTARLIGQAVLHGGCAHGTTCTCLSPKGGRWPKPAPAQPGERMSDEALQLAIDGMCRWEEAQDEVAREARRARAEAAALQERVRELEGVLGECWAPCARRFDEHGWIWHGWYPESYERQRKAVLATLRREAEGREG